MADMLGINNPYIIGLRRRRDAQDVVAGRVAETQQQLPVADQRRVVRSTTAKLGNLQSLAGYAGQQAQPAALAQAQSPPVQQVVEAQPPVMVAPATGTTPVQAGLTQRVPQSTITTRSGNLDITSPVGSTGMSDVARAAQSFRDYRGEPAQQRSGIGARWQNTWRGFNDGQQPASAPQTLGEAIVAGIAGRQNLRAEQAAALAEGTQLKGAELASMLPGRLAAAQYQQALAAGLPADQASLAELRKAQTGLAQAQANRENFIAVDVPTGEVDPITNKPVTTKRLVDIRTMQQAGEQQDMGEAPPATKEEHVVGRVYNIGGKPMKWTGTGYLPAA